MTWRLPLALVFAVLAVLPVRESYRSLRISATQFGRDYTERVFMSSLLVSVAGCIYPYMTFLLPVVPYLFLRKHIFDVKGFWAFVSAIAIVAVYFCIAVRFSLTDNPFLIYF
ncbi:MAG: hypothetical protein K5660_00610 [Paludibacteraceae bacterium]|nr:hypothetical protein [Paludibacteraceae bacterium]